MKTTGKCWLRMPFIIFLFMLLPTLSLADPGDQYCITPPFITAGIKPNLLLMIDNSASMYDLAYQDTANTYCANAPTTACTAGTTCSGAATCRSSGVTTTTTTSSAKPCTSNSDCTASGSKCTSGYCTKCNTNTGVGDCVSTISTSFTPTACTTDATCSAITTGDTCNNKCDVTRQCYDTTYSATTTYTGYFDATATYAYDFTSNKFTSGATMPGTCTYSTGTPKYVCVNTTGSGSAETVVTDSTGFVASGSFLNWLTASKFDVEKQILTGGKYDTTNQILLGESRGCAGRRYIKAVPGVSLTFAIRGGTSGGISSTQSQATEYGQTYIEIYAGTYNASDCLSAMNDWMNVTSSNPPQLGKFQNDTKGCVGTAGALGGVTAVSVWNHILHDCYQGMTGGAGGYGTNLGPLEGECQSIYATVAPSAMTDPNAGYAVCSSVLSYTDASNNPQTGYLGACWNGTNFSTLCTQTQQEQRMANYCIVNVTANPVADPSSTALTNNGQSAPGFILEQGLLNTQSVGRFPVKIMPPLVNGAVAPPEGLVDKYKDAIRFGVMTFQNNGSGSECGSASLPCVQTCSLTTTRICYFPSDCPTGETCGALAKTDGGKTISYIGAGNCSVTTATPCTVDSDCASLTPSGQYCKASVGSHSSGLIKSIDDIPATSWTPFAEGFYNAMGYFARSNNYSASPPTSRSDANFSSLPVQNTATSYDSNKNPSQYRCQSNNVLLVTDGMSTADRNSASEDLATLYSSQVPYTIGGTTYVPGGADYNSAKNHGYDSTNSCPSYSGSRSISSLAWVAKNRNIKTLTTTNPASTTPPQQSSESITTYVVYSGPQTSSQPDLCDPKTLMTNTAANGGTTLFSATNPTELNTKLDAALSTVAAKAASGTAASILSNSEGSGANILQAVFYPKKIFDNSTSVNWIGEMQNLWYYVDPLINNSTIREDTDGDLKLNLVSDYVTRFAFDSSSDKTMVQLYQDTNGDGSGDTAVGGLIDPDYVNSIWRAGMKLWARDDASDERTIYTGYNSTSGNTPQTFSNSGAFNSPTSTALWDALQIPTGTDTQRQALATNLINYIRGTDQLDDTAPCLGTDCEYRPRKVTMNVCSSNAQRRCTTATVAMDCPSGNTCSSINHEWKLGDIISSTPRVQSTVRLGTYNLPAPGGYNDKTYESFITSNDYKNRGMVYVGANDGMLHAFKLGKLSVEAKGFEKASLSGENLGKEEWAFIPKNSLPYLKYLADKEYKHLYYVDGRTLMLDASIGDNGSGGNYGDQTRSANTWRTVVIGGMGIGGASRNINDDTCTTGASGTCVKTPVDGLGYSSYFALDITNQTFDPITGALAGQPKFMWEFSHPELGFATSGPAIVRVGASQKNGRWFAVFGSGPTGPIDTSSSINQFMGSSSQTLKFFVVDLNAVPPFVLNTNYWIIGTLADGTTIDEAFSGTLLGASIDADRRYPTRSGNYQDDAIYAGYVKKAADGTWTDGGVVRIMTKEDPNPANWRASKVIEGIGPVTSAIARTQDTRDLNKNLWLYFGTGRYFYRNKTTPDDNGIRRSLYGIQEPCYDTTNVPGNVLDGNCTTTFTVGSLANQTDSISSLGTTYKGWKINLDIATATEGAERVVTDPVALTNGTVFFTSFKPTMDVCGYGGDSLLWGVKYDTGGEALASALKGKALIQLSTGEFKEVDLSGAFTGAESRLNRRMSTPMTGKPPSDAPPIISSSQNRPLKKILHIQEH